MTSTTIFGQWRFRDAWRALGRLWEDPDDTTAVFQIIDALPGRAVERAFRRFQRIETGQRVLREEIDLLDVLRDRESLRTLPPESLGQAYLEFVTSRNLTADGLVDASLAGTTQRNEDPDRARFGARLRDMHDVWHVVTGYDCDLRGEVALLAFNFAQIRTPGIGFIVAMSYKDTGPEERRLIRDAWRRGRRAAWLAGADWEALMPRPLAEVRNTLRVGDPPVYERVFSERSGLAAQNA